MGLLSKLAFWKKEPELPPIEGLGKESGFKGPGGFGEAGLGKPGFGEPGAPGAGKEGGFGALGLGKEPGLGKELEPGLPEIEPGYGGGPGMPKGPGPQAMQQMQRPQQPWPQQQAQPYGAPMTPVQPAPREYTMSKDIEIVSSKLDALKATLDGINQRLANLERLAQEKKRW